MIVLNIDKVKKYKKSLRKSTASTYMHGKTLQQIATKIKAFFITSYLCRSSIIYIQKKS